ncbi:MULTISPECIES: hypothetical protein [unclassified Limnothrix]|nr:MULTISPECIES: hypothetical protein [unclassified Limnothrix]
MTFKKYRSQQPDAPDRGGQACGGRMGKAAERREIGAIEQF